MFVCWHADCREKSIRECLSSLCIKYEVHIVSFKDSVLRTCSVPSVFPAIYVFVSPARGVHILCTPWTCINWVTRVPFTLISKHPRIRKCISNVGRVHCTAGVRAYIELSGLNGMIFTSTAWTYYPCLSRSPPQSHVFILFSLDSLDSLKFLVPNL